MHRPKLLLAVMLGLLTLPGVAAGHTIVICHVGGPGTGAQARPWVDKFLRHLEKVAGQKAGSFSGEYHTTLGGCLSYVARHKPLFGVFDLPTYLRQRKAWKISPLGHLGKADDQRYHVLVRKGSHADLAALKGKTLVSTVADLNFVSRIILGGKLDVAKQMKVKTTRRPLRGINHVARGKKDATLVDAVAHAELKELKLPVQLVSIHRSAGLPGLTLAVLQVHSAGAKQLVAKMAASLTKLCSGEGQRLCQSLSIKAFSKARPAIYHRLEKQYQGK